MLTIDRPNQYPDRSKDALLFLSAFFKSRETVSVGTEFLSPALQNCIQPIRAHIKMRYYFAKRVQVSS